MKKVVCLLCVLAAAMAARAEMVLLQLEDGITLRAAADVRARYEGFGMAATNPDAPGTRGSRMEYLRVRSRVALGLDMKPFSLNLRLGNRVHYVTTSPARPNNNGAGTWEFPDEVFVDAANVVVQLPCGDGKLSLTLGRQDLALGNGMIMSEGTPFDQGRSVYHDGAVARLSLDDSLKMTFFAFYDRRRDGMVFINDRNRDLRSGDIFTAGAYATMDYLSGLCIVDAYYMFNDLDDTRPLTAERAHAADASVDLHTVGARAFSKGLGVCDYSLEAAQQFGRGPDGEELAGTMVDGRLMFHLAKESDFDPQLNLELTHLSGDDARGGRNRAWNPLMSQCPLWGEELMPILLNGTWSNLNIARANFTCKLTKECSLSLYAMDYYADDRDGSIGGAACTGGGSHVGLLAGTMVGWKITDNFSCQGWLSHFMAGDYYANGHDSNWFRLELTMAL